MIVYLKEFVGRNVEVWSGDGHKDSGALQSVDDQWVVIKQGEDLLFFPIARIRLVKLAP